MYMQCLHCDLRFAAKNTPSLPADITQWKSGLLAGKHVLQIEAFEEIGDETWKVLLTDGTTSVAGFELCRVVEFSALAPGAKLFVADVQVRHGLLLLGSHNAKFLGGRVSVGKRKRATTLKEFKGMPAPSEDRVWAYVGNVKKYYWSSTQQRYLLVVSLRDSSSSLDVVFSESHLTMLFGGKGSETVRALDAKEQAALQAVVQEKLEKYEGMMHLERRHEKTSSSHTTVDKLPVCLDRQPTPPDFDPSSQRRPRQSL